MDQADDELRVTIQHIWPLQAKKILDLLVPRNTVLNSGKLTVGKIYAGLLILESWRNTRFGQIDSGLPVSAIGGESVKHTHSLWIYLSHNHCLDRILHVVFSIIKTCIKSISETWVRSSISNGKVDDSEHLQSDHSDFHLCIPGGF